MIPYSAIVGAISTSTLLLRHRMKVEMAAMVKPEPRVNARP